MRFGKNLIGDFLALGVLIKNMRLAKGDVDIKSTLSQKCHQMGKKRQIAGPGRQCLVIAPERHAMQLVIGYCHRLDGYFVDMCLTKGFLRRAKKRTLKWQYLVAGTGCAFCKQHHYIAVNQSLGNCIALRCTVAAFVAIDKNRALQFSQPVDDGPALNVIFSDETDFANAPQYDNIGP